MKKLFYLFPLALGAVTLQSCISDDEAGRHQVVINSPTGVGILYADQTRDSVKFTTYDSFEVKSYNTSWINVENSKNYPSSATISNSYFYYYLCRVDLTFKPNTSTDCRYGNVSVRSFCNSWDQTAYANYYQLYWHNIQYPVPAYTRNSDGDVTGVTYMQKDSALQTVDTLRFVAYDKWTLSAPENSFISLPRTSGSAGKQTLVLSMPVNESAESRTTELTLKSDNGATTVVTYSQAGKK